MVKNTTEAKVRRILEKNDPVTRIAGQSDTKLSEQSYFEVYELTLDKDEDEVKLLISGNEVFVALQASLLPAIQKLIRHELARADLGTFVGYPYAEYTQQHIAPVSVQIHWRLSGTKPYEPRSATRKLNGRTPPRPWLTIPNIHRSRCTWENIKQIGGGENGISYGPWYAVAQMGDKPSDAKIGKGGQMKAYAATKAAAREIIESAAELSNSKILSLVSGEEVRPKDQVLKPKIRVYPAWFVIFNSARQRDRDSSSGSGAIGGKKIPLGFKPDDVRETIRKSLERTQ